MSTAEREASRTRGEPVSLYLFKGADPTLESMLRSVTIIPGTTEFGYGTTKVSKAGTPQNHLAGLATTDFVASLNDLQATASGVEHVSLVVAWHGDDLRCGECEIRPRVEESTGGDSPYAWRVGPTTRAGAQVVSTADGKPSSGGAPADRTVFEALTEIKSRGLRVTLYPFIIMDVAEGNSRPNPYGGTGQPAYPWRGRITCHPAPGQEGSPDKTEDAADQVDAFFGTAEADDFGWDAANKHVTYSGPNEWSFRRFILHLATIAEAVGGVDDFLLGSELVGLTTVRSAASTYPAVARLIELAADVRGILPDARLSYAADWSEYHSHRPGDGSGDLFFHLDPLWSDDNIDFIGIDNYLPAADWRDGRTHLDRQAGWLWGHDLRYLQANIEGGEYFDWYYGSQEDRDAQVRSPISDGAYGKPWVYRNKDMRSWWSNPHYDRPGGVEVGTATDWTPQSKPIVFTEIGCPAVDKGANQPNLFVDVKSSESGLPHYSSGLRDDAMQRAYLEAWLRYWRPEGGANPQSEVYDGPMIDWSTISVWTWDARPWPAFPNRDDFWGDAENWRRGHWINGRVVPGRDFDSGPLGPFAYTDAEMPLVRDGVTYEPVAIDRGAVTSSGNLDKATLEVRAPRDIAAAELFKAYPPAQVVSLIIAEGHVGENPNDFLVTWTGRVLSGALEGNEAKFTCEPISTAIRRPGLRRHYQYGCPHALYGAQCRANKRAATSERTVVAAGGSRVTLEEGWATAAPAEKYLRGMLGWTREDGTAELRTILRLEDDDTTLLLSGAARGLEAGMTVQVILGCDRTMVDCATLHGNIQNFGGQPWIPFTNPIGVINNFY